jgi:hypothetical protein
MSTIDASLPALDLSALAWMRLRLLNLSAALPFAAFSSGRAAFPQAFRGRALQAEIVLDAATRLARVHHLFGRL